MPERLIASPLAELTNLKRRRANTLLFGIVTPPAIAVAGGGAILAGAWQPAALAVIGWLCLTLLGSSITAYRYPQRGDR